MARYIDADLLKQCIQDNITRYFTCGAGGYCLAEDVVEDIDAFPTADVVPKSEFVKNELPEYYSACREIAKTEVAREIFEEIDKEIEEALKSNYKVLPQLEFSNELYNSVRGKIDALRGIESFIAELKKKYTEDKENDRP